MATKITGPISEAEISAIRIRQRLALGKYQSPKFCSQVPTERQQLFLDQRKEKEVFYGGAAGGGKSSALLMAALEDVHVKNYSALLLRRTYADLAKPGALLDRAAGWLRNTPAKWNEQRKQWTFPGGAKISFGYLETENDKYNYQSSEYQFIGFDELSQFSQSQYLYLFSRLRRLTNSSVPLRMRAGSNPGGVGGRWVQDRFIPSGFTPEDAQETKAWIKEGRDEAGRAYRRIFVPARMHDNPHLDQVEYLESLNELDLVTREQLLKGDWQVRERGNILPMWTDDHAHVITWDEFADVFKTKHIPQNWLLGIYQDWGCLTLDTEILTKDGWKLQSELKVGELVAGFDWKASRKIVWTPLLNIIHKERQPLVEMKSKSFRFVCTPDHSWIVKRTRRGSMAQDTYRRQRLDTVSPHKTAFVVAAECFAKGEIECSASIAAVLGWLVTDGWISEGIAYLCQKNYVGEMIEDLDASGLEWKELKPKPNGVRIFRLSASSFKMLCGQTGFTSKQDMPEIATRLTSAARVEMLRTMLMAEGTNNGTDRKAIFCQKRGPVSDAFQILATLSGYRLGVEREHESQYGESRRIPVLRHHTLNYPAVTPLDGLHEVWCPTVKEGAVVARYKGQITITGNTTLEHPCVTSWFATAPASAPIVNGVGMAGAVFLYRGLTVSDKTVREVAGMINEAMRPYGEKSRVQKWQMSHEASSERIAYQREHALSFQSWPTGKTRGIAQLRNALELVETDKPHPFKPKVKGHPRLYHVIDDPSQLIYAVDDNGLSRHRSEIAAYRWATLKSGDPTVTVVPHALFNDAIDTERAAAADYWPLSAHKTQAEIDEEKLRPELQMPAIINEANPLILQAKIQSRDLYLKRMDAEQRKNEGHMLAPTRIRFRR